MADLKSLIRVRKHDVEQKQKVLADLYRRDEDLIQQKQSLKDKVEKEREALKTMKAEMRGYFGPFAEAIKARILKIDVAREQLGKKIVIARESMRHAFAEMKKVEMTQDRRDEADLNAREKKESDMLDDIAIDQFKRKGE
jgi:flagellar export protein FliJ